MPLATITRIKCADLQEVQVQANVTATGTIANVIKSLQFNYNTLHTGLNTACPTCMVSGASKGFVSATIGGSTKKVPCPTCNGYLIYHTSDGALDPPTNPFSAPIIVTRLLPADLVEAKDAFPASTTLATMIISLRANVAVPPTNACPMCANGVSSVSTGWLTSPRRFCPLCTGQQKTVNLYTMSGGLPVRTIPTVPLPDPLPTPPNPGGS